MSYRIVPEIDFPIGICVNGSRVDISKDRPLVVETDEELARVVRDNPCVRIVELGITAREMLALATTPDQKQASEREVVQAAPDLNVCEVCGKACKGERGLLQHMKMAHPEPAAAEEPEAPAAAGPEAGEPDVEITPEG